VSRAITKRPGGRIREFHGILTVAPEMVRLFEIIGRVADAECAVLVTGETGTGKELVARAIHAAGPRRAARFIGVNCAAFSPTLLESELFGHVRGAFTGAVASRPGVFKAAHDGTLFLDEIADMPLELQAKLLRVLQEKTLMPLGSTRSINVDVRVVSATNKRLADEVEAGRFRRDLSYRIRVVTIHVPPLRARQGDAEALLWAFIDELNGRSRRRVTEVSGAAMEAVRSYEWPGNVRELHSVVEHAFVMGEGPALELSHLPPEVRGEGDLPERRPRAEDERRRILAALERHGGRRTAAAADLGMSRTTLWRKLAMHRID
jgi:transcriptional regulator with PAS, ATPase and Fis domain